MKTAEQLLNEKGVTPETMHHNSDYAYRAVCDIIGESQKEAYNQALSDVLNPSKVVMYFDEDNIGCYVLCKSILKLKK